MILITFTLAPRVRVTQSNILVQLYSSNTGMVSWYSTGVFAFLTAAERYMGVSANQTQDRHGRRYYYY